ncbi:hypothetical protein C8A01DRAFT_51390 [Parachaetomium inaequale]|uniref:Rhodopsin domain-containing protein n=1 Tax=Parachaetomium inaequale TaxID=2588326 RepID=A0AAN6P4F9_9PEZI|nr:hypothetical protein C8A01DRAFT_51390 [Parachaetomium inaequale]
MPVIPTPEEIQYMEDHIDESLAPALHISAAVAMTAATVAVILRFLARRKTESGLGGDDYCLFLGYFFYMSYMIALEYDTKWGLGRHVILLVDARSLVINTYVCIAFYVFGMATIKTSILLLYHRIFPNQTFRKALLVLGALIFAWAMAAFFLSILTCVPVESSWDITIQGRCINYGTVTLVIGIFNILMDFIILVYPMPMLWKLQMPRRRKILLSFAFGAGSIACVVSIARLFYAQRVESTYDTTWDNVWAAMLSGLEMCTAIVACCTVTYRPLIERIFGTGGTGKSGSKASLSRDKGTHSKQGWSEISNCGSSRLLRLVLGSWHLHLLA